MNFIVWLTVLVGVSCVQTRAKELSVSVIIPCVPKHVPYLFNLVSYYAQQTKIPEEVIISLSEADFVGKGILNRIVDHTWPFKVIMIYNKERTSAGKNRNLGADAAREDILMFQDADDIPHPQRVEVVKYFFENYDIYHLMHFYVPAKKITHDGNIPDEFVRYDKTKIVRRSNVAYEETSSDFPFHNGQPCILRSLSKKIRWPDQWNPGEDVVYSRNVYRMFPNKTMILKAHLVLYRCELTSGWK